MELIENYKKQPNTTVILITATLSFIARPVADYAGVHDLIATELEKKDEIYTGIAGTPCLREGKLERFKTWLKERNISPQHTVFIQ